MAGVRKQLTLFVPPDAAVDIEAVRKLVDPVQFGLIAAHVTLCREDELGDLASVEARLRDSSFDPLELRFGRVEVFSEHGLWMRCIGGEEGFRALRGYLLGSDEVRDQIPHITLAHPRNPKAPGNSPRSAATLPEPLDVTFPTVHLIEQERGAPWRVLERYELRGASRP
jgi:hypothetical protein